jgi:hypothetical protein
MSMIAMGSGAAARGLPVFLPYTEATADANTAVWEFTGGAGANETGAGGGLTGADQVLTQVNGIPAAIGGFRSLAANQKFTCSPAMLAAMVNGPTWAMMWRVKEWSNAASSYLSRMIPSDTTKGRVEFYKADSTGALLGGGALNGVSFSSVYIPTPMGAGFDGWAASWVINNNWHIGYLSGDAPPTGWDSIPAGQRQVLYGHGQNTGAVWSTLDIIGAAAGYPTLRIGRLVISKLGLQGAPV